MRRSKKYQRPVRELKVHQFGTIAHYETGRDGLEYRVQHIRQAKKQYICPSCNGLILVGEAHEVAWTEQALFGAEAGLRDRRHWHSSCWKARGRQQ